MNGPQAASGERDQLAQDFVQFAIESGVLRFGEFKTKAGRMSPYFFNAGLFDDGGQLGGLAQFYARALLASGIELLQPGFHALGGGRADAIEVEAGELEQRGISNERTTGGPAASATSWRRISCKPLRHRKRRAALRRIQDQGGAHEPLFLRTNAGLFDDGAPANSLGGRLAHDGVPMPAPCWPGHRIAPARLPRPWWRQSGCH